MTQDKQGAAVAASLDRPAWLDTDCGPTDTELLDFLQRLTNQADYTGRVALRDSSTGRGWRLHETSRKGYADVRLAIVQYAVDRYTRDEEPGTAPQAPLSAADSEAS